MGIFVCFFFGGGKLVKFEVVGEAVRMVTSQFCKPTDDKFSPTKIYEQMTNKVGVVRTKHNSKNNDEQHPPSLTWGFQLYCCLRQERTTKKPSDEKSSCSKTEHKHIML